MSKPRITINLHEGDFLEIWLNEAGRDALVNELLGLNAKNDHFHMMPQYIPADIQLLETGYRPDDKVMSFGKVYFRPDEWDKEFFPEVFAKHGEENSS